MPEPGHGDSPDKGKAWTAMYQIAIQACGALAASGFAELLREFLNWWSS